jgi:hypothetical protein
MARLNPATLGFSVILATTASAQVRIIVPAPQFKVHDEIHAKVENTGSNAVTFCVEFGQTSMKEGDIESTPSPFWVQRSDNNKWGTLLIGPDVGSARASVVLQPRESRVFPFRLNDTGKMRLRLNYWRGSIPKLDCHAPAKGAKLVTSRVFTIE